MKRFPALILVLLVGACFSVAILLQPRADAWKTRANSAGVLTVLLGDSRRIFGTEMFIKADISFHSGYYPSVFDQAQRPKDSSHMTAEENEEEEKKADFFGKSKDWVEAFGRNFKVVTHNHLEHGQEREMLPWLKLSAELDPQRIDTYTVAAYWMRSRLDKVAEAEQFLREGIRNNPKSYELLFELGRLYNDNYHDTTRARNVWELARRYWQVQEPGKKEPDLVGLHKIELELGHLEEQTGNFQKAIEYLEEAVKTSPSPEAVKQRIAEIRQKLSSAANAKH